MIRCGWCGHPTADMARCQVCRHADPAVPWLQRGEEPPAIAGNGRPPLEARAVRQQLRDARAALGADATVGSIARQLGVSARTVRRWQQMAG